MKLRLETKRNVSTILWAVSGLIIESDMRVLVNDSVRDVIYTSDQLTETDEAYFLFKIHMTS